MWVVGLEIRGQLDDPLTGNAGAFTKMMALRLQQLLLASAWPLPLAVLGTHMTSRNLLLRSGLWREATGDPLESLNLHAAPTGSFRK